jgi:predicted phosphodiesterase
MAKILALSDMHGVLPMLDTTQIDIILIAGDVCPAHDHSVYYQKNGLM